MHLVPVFEQLGCTVRLIGWMPLTASSRAAISEGNVALLTERFPTVAEMGAEFRVSELRSAPQAV
jgi:hypothetical protein